MTLDNSTALPETGGPSRRSLLAAGAVGASAVALAACSKASSPDNPTVTRGPAGSSAGAGATLAKLSDITVGSAISATGTDGSKIIIARPTGTTVAAFSAICTHQGCVVEPAGNQLDCPCHGSVFDALTGAVVNGPASRPLPAVNVKVSGGDIVAG
ncbi:MAG TPA: Rieske (2Fe-2S) protein [Jatrophihabitans sp.]|nr:Rieske (2Fe-2S) protein [Jatrophihabitans sp.]